MASSMWLPAAFLTEGGGVRRPCCRHTAAQAPHLRPAPRSRRPGRSRQQQQQHVSMTTVAPRALPKLEDIIPLQSTRLPPRAVDPATAAQDEEGGGAAHAYVPPPVREWHQDPVLMSGCEPHLAPLNVAVLLSGGVDSSLALRLLVAAGHRCKAFYLQIWFQEDFRNFWDACPWEEDLEFARKVCDSLGVPLEVVPMTSAYWDRVVAESVREIRAGRTPNPDVLCNSRVKFGAFLDHLDQQLLAANGDNGSSSSSSSSISSSVTPAPAQDAAAAVGSPAAEGQGLVQWPWERQGFDRVASGHYARVARRHRAAAAAAASAGPAPVAPTGGKEQEGEVGAYLELTPDAVKDQTYFLAHLRPSQLSRAMFPLGGLTKQQVRALAAAAGLATQARKDSQGICFLGKVKFPEFVKEHLGEWKGLIVEDDDGDDDAPQQQQGGEEGSAPADAAAAAAAVPPQRQRRRQAQQPVGGGRGGAAPTLGHFGGRRVLGVHAGFWFYTVGQRGGIKLPGGPWYVTRKDCELNVVYVSRRYKDPGRGTGRRNAFVTGPFCWLSDARPQQPPGAGGGPLLCKVRHGPHAYRCQLRPLPAASAASSSAAAAGTERDEQRRWPAELDQGALVVLDGDDQGLAAGQYAVLYQGGVCLGCAKIEGCVAAGEGGAGALEYDGADATGAAGVLTSLGLAAAEPGAAR